MEEKKKNLILNIVIVIFAILIIVGIVEIIVGITNKSNTNNNTTTTATETRTKADRMADICIAHLRNSLKDPSSLQVHGKYAYYDTFGDLEYIVLDAGGKNGFGGVTRNYFVYSSTGSYVGNDEDSSTKSILNSSKYTILPTSQEYKK